MIMPATWSVEPNEGGSGGEGTRTHDPLVANQVLYQLSYAPLYGASRPSSRGPMSRWPYPWRARSSRLRVPPHCPRQSPGVQVVGLIGFEPTTSRLSGGRSNQLSYRPRTWRAPGAHMQGSGVWRRLGGAANQRTWLQADVRKGGPRIQASIPMLALIQRRCRPLRDLRRSAERHTEAWRVRSSYPLERR